KRCSRNCQGYADSLSGPDGKRRRLVGRRSCGSKTAGTVCYTSRDQEQFALERNSVNSSIAFISHASGRIRVSGNCENGFSLGVILSGAQRSRRIPWKYSWVPPRDSLTSLGMTTRFTFCLVQTCWKTENLRHEYNCGNGV